MVKIITLEKDHTTAAGCRRAVRGFLPASVPVTATHASLNLCSRELAAGRLLSFTVRPQAVIIKQGIPRARRVRCQAKGSPISIKAPSRPLARSTNDQVRKHLPVGKIAKIARQYVALLSPSLAFKFKFFQVSRLRAVVFIPKCLARRRPLVYFLRLDIRLRPAYPFFPSVKPPLLCLLTSFHSAE